MTFFTPETLDFWRGLAADNSKAYFDAHRTDYERHLKEPYRALAAAHVEVAGVLEQLHRDLEVLVRREHPVPALAPLALE